MKKNNWILAGFVFSVVALGFFTSCKKQSGTRFIDLGVGHTNIDFENKIVETESFNILDYLYFYNGGGVAAGDIDNDGLVDLYFTSNQGGNGLYRNTGGLEFEEITEKAGVAGEQGTQTWTTSATMVDINADGFLDIYVCQVNGHDRLKGRNRLYVNNGDLTFTESAADYGLDLSTYSQQALFFDADMDGDLDVFLLNHAVHTPESYKRADIRKTNDILAGDRLFINDDGYFRDNTEASGIYSGPMGYGLSASIADLNNDTWPDIYVANDFHENDYLYYNKGNGTFEEAIAFSTKHNSAFTMGTDIADVNNDGWMDIFTLDMKPEEEEILKRSAGVDSYDIYNYKLDFGYHHQYSRNMLQLNRGRLLDSSKVSFSEIGQLKGLSTTDWSWSANFEDLDNNGYMDLYVTNGIPRRPNDLDFTNYTANEIERDSLTVMEGLSKMPDGSATNYVFVNDRGNFISHAKEWGLDKNGFSNGSVILDLDNDGDLDIVVNNLNERATVYDNTTVQKDSSHYLVIQLKGSPQNKWGIGTRVQIFVNGQQQVKENKPNGGWLSSKHTNRVHFGIGENDRIDSLVVTWSDGKQQLLGKSPADTVINVSWINANSRPSISDLESDKVLSDKTDISGIDFVHRENGFTNFNTEKLIPHTLTAEGPKLAIGDVNKDGLDDIYIGGAKGQAGVLYVQNQMGNTIFSKREVAAFEDHWVYEDTDATFFDADGDGDLDLYVVSGGSEQFKGDVLNDRLYTNNGDGHFSYADKSQLPNTGFNGSCAVPFDANGDGLMDLFVGNRAYPTKYGLPAASKFYLNRGEGNFVDASVSLLENRGSIGMVTDAIWEDHRKELIIVGEWMPVTIYSFKEGNIQRHRLEDTAGWWNAVELADLNNDGETEVLLGNLGLNTNLRASVAEPMDLFVHDFDGNLSTDPIMSYYKDGRQWPYAHLDLLAEQIVNIKRTYRTYESFAKSTFSDVFPKEQLNKGYHAQTQTLTTSYLKLEEGKYRLKSFPEVVQYSKVYGFTSGDFDADGYTDVLAVGNFYGNHPSMGRSDASFGTYLTWKDESLKEVSYDVSGFKIDGQSRDIKVLNGRNGQKYILVTRNNGGVLLFSYGQK